MVDKSASATPTIYDRTWFAIDGALDPIAFEGPSFFRFPEELARLIVDRFSKPGDLVLDPFCGFGTTLVAAETLGRRAIGIEKDGERFEFASGRVHEPNRVIHGSAGDLAAFDLPLVDLVFTSPPYTSFREWDEAGFRAYWDDFDSIFSNFGRVLAPTGRLVVEVSNVRESDGHVRPVAFESAVNGSSSSARSSAATPATRLRDLATTTPICSSTLRRGPVQLRDGETSRSVLIASGITAGQSFACLNYRLFGR